MNFGLWAPFLAFLPITNLTLFTSSTSDQLARQHLSPFFLETPDISQPTCFFIYFWWWILTLAHHCHSLIGMVSFLLSRITFLILALTTAWPLTPYLLLLSTSPFLSTASSFHCGLFYHFLSFPWTQSFHKLEFIVLQGLNHFQHPFPNSTCSLLCLFHRVSLWLHSCPPLKKIRIAFLLIILPHSLFH